MESAQAPSNRVALCDKTVHQLIVGEDLTFFSQGFHLCPLCWWPLSCDGQRVDTTPEAVDDAIASLVSSERGRDVLKLARSINQAVDATLEQLESRSTKATSTSASIDGQHAGAQSDVVAAAKVRLGAGEYLEGDMPVNEEFAALAQECGSQPMRHASEAEANGQQHSHVDLAVVEAANELLEVLDYRLVRMLVSAMAEERASQSMEHASESETNEQHQSDTDPVATAAAIEVLARMAVRLRAALIELLVYLTLPKHGASDWRTGSSSIG